MIPPLYTIKTILISFYYLIISYFVKSCEKLSHLTKKTKKTSSNKKLKKSKKETIKG